MGNRDDEYDYLFKGKKYTEQNNSNLIQLVKYLFFSCTYWGLWGRKVQLTLKVHKK